MPDLDVVAQIAEAVYHIQPRQIEALPPLFDWRGIYRIRDAQDRAWLLRLLRLDRGLDAFTQNARLLQWIEQQQHPAPRVCTTHDHHIIGVREGWTSLLLSYVEGSVFDFHSSDWEWLGRALGALHALPLTGALPLPQSRCDPATLQDQTAQQLAQGYNHVPAAFQPLVAALRSSLRPLAGYEQELRITHGDCWYKNAIKTDDGVVLIDWDCAGIGLPLLDVGYLLLTSHYDLTQPCRVVADKGKIQAILYGYQAVQPIVRPEPALMASAVQFALAWGLGEYLETHASVDTDEGVLQKMQARFDATAEIAQIAMNYVA
ncbi:MAG: aminoglycoside phosphotransferase family protein [Chloroflexales bacterium]|nr:aminoglycoside phosphotransferase family protein [Chloroflexales bacterium]